jgi:glycosyltransferase involved in cell wall biosynthesis
LRVLMLAPEPFFEPRGTPFSEYHRIKALGELGHHVDLVTYPFGKDVDLPNLRIIRCLRPPFLRGVRIGPSLAKAALDALLAVTAIRQAGRERYDAVHSHEEMGVLGVWLSRRLGVPHLYDMHSSLPQQLTNFRFSRSRWLCRLFERAERHMIEGSRVVITICPALQEAAVRMGAGHRSVLIENVMGGDMEGTGDGDATGVRAEWGIGEREPLILYTGTFEPYQGLDLLLGAVARLQRSHPAARLLVVGGEPAQVTAASRRAMQLGATTVFTGRRPAGEIPGFVAACDILASPRVSGTNTPLKLYSYLRSGKPIVATDLPTHTQVLDSEIAVLAPPDEESFAAALARVLDNPEDAASLASAASARAAARYSRETYLSRTSEAYARLAGPAEGAAGVAELPGRSAAGRGAA